MLVEFTTIGAGSQDYLARLNSNGTLDTGFTLNTDARVDAIHQDADGKIYVGGNFYYNWSRIAR